MIILTSFCTGFINFADCVSESQSDTYRECVTESAADIWSWCPGQAQSVLRAHSVHISSVQIMSRQASREQSPVLEDCSDDEEYYYNNNNNLPSNNNNNTEYEDKNNNTRQQQRQRQQHQQQSLPAFHKLNERPLNITVTAKVLFGSVSAISALNAERKKKPS